MPAASAWPGPCKPPRMRAGRAVREGPVQNRVAHEPLAAIASPAFIRISPVRLSLECPLPARRAAPSSGEGTGPVADRLSP